MATASTRAASIKTPGVVSPDIKDQGADSATFEDQAASASQGEGEQAGQAAAPMAPDLAAFIKDEIAKGIAAGLAQAGPAATAPISQELPTQDQALERVIKTGRAVLSKDGYVCMPPAAANVQRDVNGFAKA